MWSKKGISERIQACSSSEEFFAFVPNERDQYGIITTSYVHVRKGMKHLAFSLQYEYLRAVFTAQGNRWLV